MPSEVGAQGVWVGADGSAREARIKGGPLFEAFHGIEGRERQALGASRGDLAWAYASAVWAYRCIKLRADAVAGVPLVLRDREGGLIPDHPLLVLLRDVNPTTMNLGDLLRATEAAYNIWGVAYWLKVRQPRRAGIKWLVWLNPQTVEVQVDPLKGITGYKQTVGAQVRTYAPEEVVAFRNFDPLDDLGGLSPLSVALSEINAELNAARYVAAFFANDARPAGLLSTDQPLHDTDLERMRSWWARLFSGAANKWKTGILGSGLRWQQITFAPSDLALSELRAEDRRAICAAFGVPAGLAGAWEATTFATAREQKASFYEDTILPQLEYLAEVLNWSLLPHYPDLTARGAKLAWDVDSIAALGETATDKAQRLVMLFQAGVVTREEVRAELGMPVLASPPENQPPAPAPSRAQADRSNGKKAVEVSPVPTRRRSRRRRSRGLSLQDELRQWEAFALKRARRGRTLRSYRSKGIPAELHSHIDTALQGAKTVDEIRAVFDHFTPAGPAAQLPLSDSERGLGGEVKEAA